MELLKNIDLNKLKPTREGMVERLWPFRKKRRLKDYKAEGRMDITFFALVIILLTIGLVMMFSASYVNAQYDIKTGYNPYYYIERQALYAVVGLVIMFIVSKIRYDVIKDFSYIFWLISIMLLIIVLIAPYEVAGKEEFKRWLKIPILNMTFQPSDVAKLGLIMFCAWRMEKYSKNLQKKWTGMIPYVIVIGLMCGLVFLEDHLSGTILMGAIGIAMTYLGGAKKGWFIALIIIVVLAVALLIADPEWLPDVLKGYMSERIESWQNKEADPSGARWQVNQSLNAIGSGGLFGAGIGNSRQKHLYLPEPQNDFVFAIVCEELGFIRAVLIMILFVLLVWRGFVIAMKAKDKFSSLLVMGIVFQVGLQVVLNIAVVTDTVPNTGIGLPFFSSGGTALIILLFEMGLVLSVSRYSKMRKY